MHPANSHVAKSGVEEGLSAGCEMNRGGVIPCRCPVCAREQIARWATSNGQTYLRCVHCKLLWLDEVPSEAELHTYYNSGYKVDQSAHSEKMRQQGPELLA